MEAYSYIHIHTCALFVGSFFSAQQSLQSYSQFHSHFSSTVSSTALKGTAQHIAGKGLGQRRRQPVTTVHVGYSEVCCINLYSLIYLRIHIAMYDAVTCGGLI